jgi:predicted nucleic acid-binding protein
MIRETVVVCDASVLVALLMDSGPDGTWATETVGDAEIAAPDLAAYETANIIRRHELAGLVDSSAASQAHLASPGDRLVALRNAGSSSMGTTRQPVDLSRELRRTR